MRMEAKPRMNESRSASTGMRRLIGIAGLLAAGLPAVLGSSQGKADHWAFQPISHPEPPPVADPAWPRNEIDRFILARLEEKGLRPSPEADRRTLIRRACFDVTGLPPAPEDVRAFLSDPDPAAYEHLIDRLLDSPHYGERWA